MQSWLRALVLTTGAIGAALVVTLMEPSDCGAQQQVDVWAEWDTSAGPRLGPADANGVLFYLHGNDGPRDVTGLPISSVFIEMARHAKWDIVRVNRTPTADTESEDERVVQFMAKQIGRVREDGYRWVVIGGYSRGGWLALLMSTLADVDAIIAFAPGTTSHEVKELERTRDMLARRLSRAKAKRIAAFFFDGDSAEDVPERRAAVLSHALQRTASAFMFVDRPPDFYGHSAGGEPGFVKRFSDCLVGFALAPDPRAGEVTCALPRAEPKRSVLADPGFRPYWRRWQGVDEAGVYLTLQPMELGIRDVTYGIVRSDRPGTVFEGLKGQLPFQLDVPRQRIFCSLREGRDLLVATLKSPAELELVLRSTDRSTGSVRSARAFLTMAKDD